MNFDSFQEHVSLVTLPIETRFMIYDQIINCTGTIVIFAQYELAKNMDTQTVHLLHVNRLIRAEVHEYFYKNQNFQFRSLPAMQKFFDKIGPYYAGIIKNVVIGSWLAQRASFETNIAPFLMKLTGIERLTIQTPAHGFVTEWSEHGELGHKAIAVLDASKRLAAGKFHLAWVHFYGLGVMQFAAQGVSPPSQRDSSFQNVLRGIYGCDSYLWEPGYLVEFAEVKRLDCLPESIDKQQSRNEMKIPTNLYGTASNPLYIEDDSDL